MGQDVEGQPAGLGPVRDPLPLQRIYAGILQLKDGRELAFLRWFGQLALYVRVIDVVQCDLVILDAGNVDIDLVELWVGGNRVQGFELFAPLRVEIIRSRQRGLYVLGIDDRPVARSPPAEGATETTPATTAGRGSSPRCTFRGGRWSRLRRHIQGDGTGFVERQFDRGAAGREIQYALLEGASGAVLAGGVGGAGRAGLWRRLHGPNGIFASLVQPVGIFGGQHNLAKRRTGGPDQDC